MRIPTLHLNGTSAKELVRALDELSSTLNVALGELSAAAPNGRDYYPQGPDATAEALREHADRVRRLTSVKDEIDQIRIGVADQRVGRYA